MPIPCFTWTREFWSNGRKLEKSNEVSSASLQEHRSQENAPDSDYRFLRNRALSLRNPRDREQFLQRSPEQHGRRRSSHGAEPCLDHSTGTRGLQREDQRLPCCS